MTDLTITCLAPGALAASARNARTHSARQIQQIARSIRTFGFANPILIDENDVVIAGHGRLAAANKLGLDRVPAIRLSHLNDVQKRGLMLADNRIALNAAWDMNLLARELADMSLLDLDFDVEVTGFEPAEIDIAIEVAAEATTNAPENAPEPDPDLVPVARPGDLWILGAHRLICGNARSADDLSRLMEVVPADAGFTDPPYNVPVRGNLGLLASKLGKKAPMNPGAIQTEPRPRRKPKPVS